MASQSAVVQRGRGTCLADRSGIHPYRFGELFTPLAALCRQGIHVHQLASETILHWDRRRVYQALLMAPLIHLVMSIDVMEEVADALIEGQSEWPGEWPPPVNNA